jgi:hypothetical protein
LIGRSIDADGRGWRGVPPKIGRRSIHEEVDAVPARAMMGVFNNLVVFDQHVKQSSSQSIVPDLATGWWVSCLSAGEQLELVYHR